MAFPPLDILPLGIVGLWPFIAFLDRRSDIGLWKAFVGGYTFGLAFFGLLLYWIAGLTGFSVMAIPAYVASTMVMAFNGGLIATAVVFSRRLGVPLVISFPLAWTGVEWIRSLGDLGFTWGMAGVATAGYPVLTQVAEIGGAYLLSLWLTGLAVTLYRLLRPLSAGSTRGMAVVAVALAAAVPIYGVVRLNQLEAAAEEWPTMRMAAIQPNVPQELKWEPDFQEETHRRLRVLTEMAREYDPRLVVWPESAVPRYLRFDPGTRWFVPALSREIDVPIFTGTNDADTLPGASGIEVDDYVIYNAAYLVRPGEIEEGRWAKRRLVPIAERVPFIPGMATSFFERLSSWTGQFEPGREWTTWSVGSVEFGALICYESTFPDVSRSLVLEGADFLLNITNDAWFGRSAAPYQHASHLSLRAVEHRVSFLRAANTGISGWVDPLGRYRARTGLYTFGAVVADLPIPGIRTPYTRWGDWVPLASLVLLVLWCGARWKVQE